MSGTRKSTTGGQHSFANIPSAEIQRSKFNRSSGLKTTFDAGLLIPVFCDEALPGDTFNLRMSTFARLATPIVPIMDNMYLDSHFFSVPIRLLWDNWQKFNGEQDNPGDSTDFLTPIMVAPPAIGFVEGSISDYFGMPVGIPGIEVNSLWHRAYALIYHEWFRDENLQTSTKPDTNDGPDLVTGFPVRRRGKRHDYFSSCLPFPQKGDPVEINLGGVVPVVGNGNPPTFTEISGSGGPQTLAMDPFTIGNVVWSGGVTTGGNNATWNVPNLQADLSTATAITINQLREAFQVQRLLERDARGGTRYTEVIRSHFGVTSPDQRLQRPEYLGGGSQIISITPVPQTSETAAGGADPTPQGNLAGYGVSQGSGHSFTKSFVEHCIIIGLVSVRADLNYQQGLNRMYSRRSRFDYFWPALAHLGEQAVLNQEIYMQGTADPAADADVFGYQERYAEYRYKPSQITGKMRSVDAQTLDIWHLAQEFSSLPVLGDTFIQETPPVDRVIAVPSEPHFLFDAFFDLQCARPMPTYGVPGMIDHF